GAIISDMTTAFVLDDHPKNEHLVADVTNDLRGLYSGAVFGAESLTGLIMEPEFNPAASRGRAAHQAPPITADPVNSVAVQSSRWIESDNITDRLAEHPEVVKLMIKVNGHDPDD